VGVGRREKGRLTKVRGRRREAEKRHSEDTYEKRQMEKCRGSQTERRSKREKDDQRWKQRDINGATE
jgi:hypothetical protein